jgi:hypothetical protein
MSRKKNKNKSKVNNQKKVDDSTICWLTESQESDEKSGPIIWTERPTGEVMGAGSSLASKVGLSCQGPPSSLS